MKSESLTQADTTVTAGQIKEARPQGGLSPLNHSQPVTSGAQEGPHVALQISPSGAEAHKGQGVHGVATTAAVDQSSVVTSPGETPRPAASDETGLAGAADGHGSSGAVNSDGGKGGDDSSDATANGDAPRRPELGLRLKSQITRRSKLSVDDFRDLVVSVSEIEPDVRAKISANPYTSDSEQAFREQFPDTEMTADVRRAIVLADDSDGRKYEKIREARIQQAEEVSTERSSTGDGVLVVDLPRADVIQRPEGDYQEDKEYQAIDIEQRHRWERRLRARREELFQELDASADMVVRLTDFAKTHKSADDPLWGQSSSDIFDAFSEVAFGTTDQDEIAGNFSPQQRGNARIAIVNMIEDYHTLDPYRRQFDDDRKGTIEKMLGIKMELEGSVDYLAGGFVIHLAKDEYVKMEDAGISTGITLSEGQLPSAFKGLSRQIVVVQAPKDESNVERKWHEDTVDHEIAHMIFFNYFDKIMKHPSSDITTRELVIQDSATIRNNYSDYARTETIAYASDSYPVPFVDLVTPSSLLIDSALEDVKNRFSYLWIDDAIDSQVRESRFSIYQKGFIAYLDHLSEYRWLAQKLLEAAASQEKGSAETTFGGSLTKEKVLALLSLTPLEDARRLGIYLGIEPEGVREQVGELHEQEQYRLVGEFTQEVDNVVTSLHGKSTTLEQTKKAWEQGISKDLLRRIQFAYSKDALPALLAVISGSPNPDQIELSIDTVHLTLYRHIDEISESDLQSVRKALVSFMDSRYGKDYYPVKNTGDALMHDIDEFFVPGGMNFDHEPIGVREYKIMKRPKDKQPTIAQLDSLIDMLAEASTRDNRYVWDFFVESYFKVLKEHPEGLPILIKLGKHANNSWISQNAVAILNEKYSELTPELKEQTDAMITYVLNDEDLRNAQSLFMMNIRAEARALQTRIRKERGETDSTYAPIELSDREHTQAFKPERIDRPAEDILAVAEFLAGDPDFRSKLIANPYSPESRKAWEERFPYIPYTRDMMLAVILAEPKGEYDKQFEQLGDEERREQFLKEMDATADMWRSLTYIIEQDSSIYRYLSSRTPDSIVRSIYDTYCLEVFGTSDTSEIEQHFSRSQRREVRAAISNLVEDNINLAPYKEEFVGDPNEAIKKYLHITADGTVQVETTPYGIILFLNKTDMLKLPEADESPTGGATMSYDFLPDVLKGRIAFVNSEGGDPKSVRDHEERHMQYNILFKKGNHDPYDTLHIYLENLQEEVNAFAKKGEYLVLSSITVPKIISYLEEGRNKLWERNDISTEEKAKLYYQFYENNFALFLYQQREYQWIVHKLYQTAQAQADGQAEPGFGGQLTFKKVEALLQITPPEDVSQLGIYFGMSPDEIGQAMEQEQSEVVTRITEQIVTVSQYDEKDFEELVATYPREAIPVLNRLIEYSSISYDALNSMLAAQAVLRLHYGEMSQDEIASIRNAVTSRFTKYSFAKHVQQAAFTLIHDIDEVFLPGGADFSGPKPFRLEVAEVMKRPDGEKTTVEQVSKLVAMLTRKDSLAWEEYFKSEYFDVLDDQPESISLFISLGKTDDGFVASNVLTKLLAVQKPFTADQKVQAEEMVAELLSKDAIREPGKDRDFALREQVLALQEKIRGEEIPNTQVTD